MTHEEIVQAIVKQIERNTSGDNLEESYEIIFEELKEDVRKQFLFWE